MALFCKWEQRAPAGLCWFFPWEAMATGWRKGEGKVRVSLPRLCLELHLQNLQSSWVSPRTSPLAGQAPRGSASVGGSWPLGSSNLLYLPLQPRSGSSFFLVLISCLPPCVLFGHTVFPSPVKPTPYHKFTIFEYRKWCLYFWVGSDGYLPRELVPELFLKGREEIC